MTYKICDIKNSPMHTHWGDFEPVEYWLGAPKDSLEEQPEYLHIATAGGQLKEWLVYLPKLQKLRYLWIKGRANLELITIIGQITSLEKLNIDALGCDTLAPLENLKNLTHLSLMNSTKISDLSPLSKLTNLVGLNLLGFDGVHTLDAISPLSENLKALYLFGRDSKSQKYTNLNIVNELQNLEELHLWNVKLESPLELTERALPNLKLINFSRTNALGTNVLQHLKSKDICLIQNNKQLE